MTTFKQLGLSDEVLKVLPELGFEEPSKIQALAIPKLIEGDHDLIGLAQTGTGKTAAFGLPLLERIDPYFPHTQALVLAPTRELGKQIADQLETYSKYLDRISVLAVYGGAPIHTQIKALHRPQHIIIATPGRLIDLIKRKAVKLDQLQILVLDEADEMLNMGFKPDIDRILSYTPSDKLTWLFSATMPPPIKEIVNRYMDHPVEIKINAQDKVNVNIEHQFAIVRQADKMEALSRFLDINPDMRGVVFCRTKWETRKLAEKLQKKGYLADAIHGDLSQSQRDRVMDRFRSHDLQVLVATDVAARGIDVNDLTHVFHYSLPDDQAYYTHRSGRTARAGKEGISIAFVHERELYRIRHIQQDLGISFQRVAIPQARDIAIIRMENWCLDILRQKSNGKVSPELMEQAMMLFGNLSKEELLHKVLSHYLNSLQLGGNQDLNPASSSRGKAKKKAHSAPKAKSKAKSKKKKKRDPQGKPFWDELKKKDQSGRRRTRKRKKKSKT